MKPRKWTRPQQIFVALYVLCWLYITAMHVARADDSTPVHVFVVWVNEKDGSIEYSQHILITDSADRCAQLTLKEAAPHVKDFAANSKKWTPHIVCGVAAEHYVAPKQETEPEEEPDDPENSHPGTGGDQPSAEL
jgi:hypothetical protein